MASTGIMFISYCEYQFNGSEIWNLNGHTKTAVSGVYFLHTHTRKEKLAKNWVPLSQRTQFTTITKNNQLRFSGKESLFVRLTCNIHKHCAERTQCVVTVNQVVHILLLFFKALINFWTIIITCQKVPVLEYLPLWGSHHKMSTDLEQNLGKKTGDLDSASVQSADL